MVRNFYSIAYIQRAILVDEKRTVPCHAMEESCCVEYVSSGTNKRPEIIESGKAPLVHDVVSSIIREKKIFEYDGLLLSRSIIERKRQYRKRKRPNKKKDRRVGLLLYIPMRLNGLHSRGENELTFAFAFVFCILLYCAQNELFFP